MTKQIITTPNGKRMVVLPEVEYERLLDILEDVEDAAAVRRFEQKLAAGEAGRICLPHGRWREPCRGLAGFQGLSAKALAEAAGITQAYLSQIETGKRDGTIGTMKKIADALKVTIDDLV